MMLKKLEQSDVNALYMHLLNPNLIYVRYRSQSLEEYESITQILIEKEENGEAIIRVILDEQNYPIGQIALYDIHANTGFLSTWIAEGYHGKGFNQKAKELFLSELFNEKGIDIVYAKIRKNNIRSLKATEKIPYMKKINETNITVYQSVNKEQEVFDVYEITKEYYQECMLNETEK